jgi:hypothetical protein
MTTRARQVLAVLLVAAFFIGACLMFPRLLAFTERAARELRYFWWLILMLALGIWLAFFAGRRRRD